MNTKCERSISFIRRILLLQLVSRVGFCVTWLQSSNSCCALTCKINLYCVKSWGALVSSLPGRTVRWGKGFPAFKIGMMTEFFQIAGMSIPATERLKSSVRKARPWSMVTSSGAHSLTAHANTITWCWQWRFLKSLLMARSYCAEQAVNHLLKARAITFGLEWVFPSKAIEILGGGFILLPPSLCRWDQ